MSQRPVFPVDLERENALLGDEIEAAVCRVLRSGQYVLGPEVERLEASFAELCRVPHGVGVSSGTEAVVLALKAVGVGPGTTVVTSPFTFFASAGAIAWIGARPVLADVELETGLIDVEQTAKAVRGDTRALLPVHLYGQMADMVALRTLAEERGLALVEDAAQAHGAERDGHAPGELGDSATFSFYPTKNLGTVGEGGLIVTRDADMARVLRELRDHGSPAKYKHAHLGTNARLQAIQAAALNVKLPHLAAWNARRTEIAAHYDRELAELGGVQPLRTVAGAVHARHQYTVRITRAPGRDAVLARLKEAGVFAGVHYPEPVHLQEAARPWGHHPGEFPNAERLAAEVICLPVHPFLEDGEVELVVEALGAALGG